MENKTSILATKEDLAKEIGNCKAEMIKWMFIFWAGQMIALFGFVLLVLKK